MRRIFYVYIHWDPRTNLPVYVGKGTGDRCDVVIGRNPEYDRWYRNLKKQGLSPLVTKVKDNLSEIEAFDLEIKQIALIGRKDLGKGTLLNKTNGGEGFHGVINTKIPVVLISPNGKDVRLFDSIQEASHFAGIDSRHVSLAMRGIEGRKRVSGWYPISTDEYAERVTQCLN